MNRNLTQFRPSETHNLRVPTARNGLGALSITCSQSCWNLQFLLTNTDAYSDSGHQSFNLLWAKLLAIRRFFFRFFFFFLSLDFDTIVSVMPVLHIVLACVCVSTLLDVGLTIAIRLSRVRSSCPAPFYC